MTIAQRILMKYISKNFVNSSIGTIAVGKDKIKIIDGQGESMTLTMNIYGDIMDAETKSIYAISNLPHSLNDVSHQLPSDWIEVDRE